MMTSKIKHLLGNRYWIRRFTLVKTPNDFKIIWVRLSISDLPSNSPVTNLLKMLKNAVDIYPYPAMLVPTMFFLAAKLYAITSGLDIKWWKCRPGFDKLYDEVWIALPVAAWLDLACPIAFGTILKIIANKSRCFGPFGSLISMIIIGSILEGFIISLKDVVSNRWNCSWDIAPALEEPWKRLIATELGIPRVVSGAIFGVFEALYWWLSRRNRDEIPYGIICRAVRHAFFTVLPLPLAMILHNYMGFMLSALMHDSPLVLLPLKELLRDIIFLSSMLLKLLNCDTAAIFTSLY